MIKVATGDLMHVYASFERDSDYTCRLIVKMKDPVDGVLLEGALRNTERRYPYFCVHMRKNESEYYYEENHAPVALLHTDEAITLNAPQSNGHVWAVCYQDNRIILDFYHGITDGVGMYSVLATLLYYYCNKRYGLTYHEGIRTLDDPILPEETEDPLANLPLLDLDELQKPDMQEAFSIINDGGAVPQDPEIYHIEIPEPAFVRFTSASDASPGTMVSLLLLRALDEIYPQREKPLVGRYVVNARPMLHAEASCHNCVTSLDFNYDGRLQYAPFSRQTTGFRGITFLKTDEDAIRKTMTAFSSANRTIVASAPTLDEKLAAFAQMRKDFLGSYTSIVSYVGKWPHHAIGHYIDELWTHAPLANNCLGELSAIGGKICLSLHMRSDADDLLDLLLMQLKIHEIPYEIKEVVEHDIPRFAEPTD